MEILGLLDTLESMILDGTKIPLTKKILINEDKILAVIDKMRLVIVNILRNAYEELGEGGEIEINLSLREDEEGKKIRIEICDSGKGIAETEWDNIFEPFYTKKSAGIGLGLANAQKNVEQHNGSIRIIKKEGKGACFEILIPCGEVQ